MKLLFDTDVILDVLLDRHPWSRASSQLLSQVEEGRLNGYLCATSVTTLFYLLNKQFDRKRALAALDKILLLCDVAPVTRTILLAARQSKFSDFEDAVVHEAAWHLGCDGLVTRNTRDFKHAKLPVYTPHELTASNRDSDLIRKK